MMRETSSLYALLILDLLARLYLIVHGSVVLHLRTFGPAGLPPQEQVDEFGLFRCDRRTRCSHPNFPLRYYNTPRHRRSTRGNSGCARRVRHSTRADRIYCISSVRTCRSCNLISQGHQLRPSFRDTEGSPDYPSTSDHQGRKYVHRTPLCRRPAGYLPSVFSWFHLFR